MITSDAVEIGATGSGAGEDGERIGQLAEEREAHADGGGCSAVHA